MTDTYNFEYYPNKVDEFAQNIRLSFDTTGEGLPCYKFQEMCRVFGGAIGYTVETLDIYFPATDEGC